MSFSYNCFLILIFISKCQADLNTLNLISNVVTRPLDNIINKPIGFIETAFEDGYTAEEHKVTTEDGYILTLFRILTANSTTNKRPILLMHGVLQAADGFIDMGADAPAYVLSKAGYDVWLGNFRGTYHSRKHVTLDPDKDSEFWKFDQEQMGKYDAPATIDYVLRQTNSKKLIYLGYSQGGGAFLIMNSEKPEYAEKISLFIGFAPNISVLNTKSLPFRALAQSVLKLRTTLDAAGIWELFNKGFPTSTLLDTACKLDVSGFLCNFVFFLVDSLHPESLTNDIQKRALRHAPAGASVQLLAYYGQLQTTARFQKFDFGLEENLKRYGTSIPPEYNLDAVQVPSVIYHGLSDLIVDTKDIERLVDQLPMLVDYIQVKDPKWNHLDMAYSRFWKETIFEDLKKYLQEYS